MGRRLRYSNTDCIDQRACCAPPTTLFLAFVAISRGVKISQLPVLFDVVDVVVEEELLGVARAVSEAPNSGIHPPSANPELKSGKNILISGRLLRLDTISSI
jgi:hypothetical protein